MITGEKVLEVLGQQGVDFVGELHPYDRKRIEQELDAEIDMASHRDVIEKALDKFADSVIERLKARITSQLQRLCDNGDIAEDKFAAIETAVHSEIVDVVRDEQTNV